MKNSIFLLAIFSAFLFTSCSKEKSDKPVDGGDDVVTVITKSVWTLEDTEIYNTESETWISDIDDCDKDNTVLFKKDKTYSTDPGEIKCSAEDLPFSGTWLLENNNTITIDGEQFTINTVEDNKLVVTAVDSEDTHRITLKR